VTCSPTRNREKQVTWSQKSPIFHLDITHFIHLTLNPKPNSNLDLSVRGAIERARTTDALDCTTQTGTHKVTLKFSDSEAPALSVPGDEKKECNSDNSESSEWTPTGDATASDDCAVKDAPTPVIP